MPGGRPLKFQTVEELDKKIGEFFNNCDKTGIPYTITGLALALDTSRETLLEYEGEVPGREKSQEFADTIKRAKLRCHNYAEKFLYTGKNATGAIFNLKNNYGWKDKSEVDAKIQEVRPILGGISEDDNEER